MLHRKKEETYYRIESLTKYEPNLIFNGIIASGINHTKVNSNKAQQ